MITQNLIFDSTLEFVQALRAANLYSSVDNGLEIISDPYCYDWRDEIMCTSNYQAVHSAFEAIDECGEWWTTKDSSIWVIFPEEWDHYLENDCYLDYEELPDGLGLAVELLKQAMEFSKHYDDYPLFDESDYSDREWEKIQEWAEEDGWLLQPG